MSSAVAERRRFAAFDDLRRQDDFIALAAGLVGWYPVVWLIGLAPAFWVVFGAAGVVHLSRTRWTAATVAPLVLAGALALSAPIGMVRFGGDAGRLISLGANCLTWIGVAALVTAASARPRAVLPLAKPWVILGSAQGALIAGSAAVAPAQLPVPLLAPLFEHAPIGIRTFATNGLYYADWLGDLAYRSQGIMGNATWNGAVGAATIIVALACWPVWHGRWRLLSVAGVAGGLVSVQTSLSRSTMIALGIALLAGLWLHLRRRTTLGWWALTAAVVLAIALVLTFSSSLLMQAFSDVNAERAGSLETRTDIYRATLAAIAQHPFPLLGYGIKPQEDGLVASVATHSTYLGVVFRAGWLGAAALAAVLLGGIVRSLRSGNAVGLAVVTLITIWCVFEDVDGGHLLPIALAFAYARPPLPSVKPGTGTRSASRA